MNAKSIFRSLSFEAKICLPVYKILYSLCFIFLLSIVRGVSEVFEIGISLDVYMAILAAVFCADALQSEYSGKRWEIFGLCPRTIRRRTLLSRIAVQCLYLWLLSVLGYACFFLQRPGNIGGPSEALLFCEFLGAVLISILFWGMTAFTLSNLSGSSWAGIGASVILWLFAYSNTGKQVLGNLNVFAFVFRNIQNPADMDWLWGKGLALTLTLLMAFIQPQPTNRKI